MAIAGIGVDVVDLYLVHWPVPSRGLATETWKAFEKLYADGAVRAIGGSNFLPHHLADLIENAAVVPAVNQFENHPPLQQDAVILTPGKDTPAAAALAQYLRSEQALSIIRSYGYGL